MVWTASLNLKLPENALCWQVLKVFGLGITVLKEFHSSWLLGVRSQFITQEVFRGFAVHNKRGTYTIRKRNYNNAALLKNQQNKALWNLKAIELQ